MTHLCKYYLPWAVTSKGEINDVCVISEKGRREIRRCPYRDNEQNQCEDFQND
jgi:hypothetical protein